MSKEDLEVLQALRIIHSSNEFLLSDEGIEMYNILADKADKANILW